MHVVATAGHVDHGKSALVRALTGMEPDRWAEERRRGMTIDLGFAWTALPTGGELAFVDVPGHERFVPNMLAGVGPVPAALLVVAADEGWMPQTAEHVAALDALGVRHALVAVTRCDLAGPATVAAVSDDVRARLERTALRGAGVVPVSAVTGAGLPELRAALGTLVRGLPAPEPDAPVRLWVDRAFTIRGSGTVVTGTLGAGTLRVGDELVLAGPRGPHPVRVRGLQSLGRPVPEVRAVARAAVNLRGVERAELGRGDALLTPGAWAVSAVLDVRWGPSPGVPATGGLPGLLVLHSGSAAVEVRPRPLGPAAPGGVPVRLTLRRPLPVAAGDVALLRDPGRHLVVGRVTVLDVDPPPLARRGAAAARARELAALGAAGAGARPDGAALLHRHKVVRRGALAATGAAVPAGAVAVGDWLVDPGQADRWRGELAELVAGHRRRAPLEPGPTVEQARAGLSVPHPEIVTGLVEPPLAVRDGRVVDVTAPPPLPGPVAAAVAVLVSELGEQPFRAPDAARLAELRLGPRELAAAERAGALLRIADGVVLLPGADVAAAGVLGTLPQPFTLSAARQALGTSRRVAVPLLELMDRRRLTRRLPDDRRVVRD